MRGGIIKMEEVSVNKLYWENAKDTKGARKHGILDCQLHFIIQLGLQIERYHGC